MSSPLPLVCKSIFNSMLYDRSCELLRSDVMMNSIAIYFHFYKKSAKCT